jgi:hypothetical protein
LVVAVVVVPVYMVPAQAVVAAQAAIEPALRLFRQHRTPSRLVVVAARTHRAPIHPHLASLRLVVDTVQRPLTVVVAAAVVVVVARITYLVVVVELLAKAPAVAKGAQVVVAVVAQVKLVRRETLQQVMVVKVAMVPLRPSPDRA